MCQLETQQKPLNLILLCQELCMMIYWITEKKHHFLIMLIAFCFLLLNMFYSSTILYIIYIIYNEAKTNILKTCEYHSYGWWMARKRRNILVSYVFYRWRKWESRKLCRGDNKGWKKWHYYSQRLNILKYQTQEILTIE